MNLFVKDLPPETQILIAIGASVAAGCQPCLQRIVDMAKEEELEDVEMRAAVEIGQLIKDQPALQMKELADDLVGTKLSVNPGELTCSDGQTQTQVGCNCS